MRLLQSQGFNAILSVFLGGYLLLGHLGTVSPEVHGLLHGNIDEFSGCCPGHHDPTPPCSSDQPQEQTEEESDCHPSCLVSILGLGIIQDLPSPFWIQSGFYTTQPFLQGFVSVSSKKLQGFNLSRAPPVVS